MSADLLAEFGQGSGSGSSQSAAQLPQTVRPKTNSLIDGFDQTDDIFFGETSHTSQDWQQSPRLASPQSQYASAAPRQSAVYPTFDLPRQHDSDVLFDATEDAPASDTDDDWGDFEGPEATLQSQPRQSSVITPKAPVRAPAPAPQNLQDPSLAGTIDLLGGLSTAESTPSPTQPSQFGARNHSPQTGWENDSFGDWGKFTEAQIAQAAPPKASPRQNQKRTPVKSLLEDDSFGDWGDFTEEPSANLPPPKASPKKQPSLRAGAPSKTTPMKATPNKASIPTKALAATRATTSVQPNNPAKPNSTQPPWEDDAFDDWGDFGDGPAQPNPNCTSLSPPTSLSPQSFASNTPSSTPTVRPTNIPPPSILLEHLIDQLNNLQKEAQTAKTLPQPQKATTATKIHNTLHIAARIIAGRTHRWRRDTILAQSMRIGPARAGKPGGMKLSAVNKHEDVKEEQDAVDVLGLWRERAALFNSVVQAAGQKPIPVVSDPAALKVVTVRAELGGIKAGHACALCALKRDERVLRVDEEVVQDNFGEWWTEHWGHTGCRAYWEGNRGLLMQR
ncbi:uncharacterized protein N7482_000822 [Penicillium canariense]|uniref:Serine/threonine-protein kinase ppk6 n=1 Tax=Penicillium canariense TaxID=189055 RepID=A0A9W9ICR1_9EURO|nr:uncharacterized protein N7482_000822 [Penicillium canariense]KAJ5174945.1 hypothetical protein N7482_000822 [Penicillium canariense]